MTKSQCPDCGSESLDESFDDFDAVCDECGYVFLDEAEADEQPADWMDDVYTENQGEQQEAAWSDVYAISSSTEKRVAVALETIEDIGDELALSVDTRETAADIYSQSVKKQVTDGRKTVFVIAAAVYIGSRLENDPRPLTRVADAVSIDASKVDQLARMLQRELGLKQPLCNAEDYLPYLRQEIDVEPVVEDRARDALQRVHEMENSGGKSPVGFAGAAIYWAADGQVPQRKIARIAGVTKETIRVRLHDIREGL